MELFHGSFLSLKALFFASPAALYLTSNSKGFRAPTFCKHCSIRELMMTMSYFPASAALEG